jgi:magnesium chelatase family protein
MRSRSSAFRSAGVFAMRRAAIAMNPCPCGNRGDPARSCRCTPAVVRRYHARLSGPLLDRLDLQVEVPRLAGAEFDAPAAQVGRWCVPDAAGRRVLDTAMRRLKLSGRARSRVLKVARTIADLEERPG